MGQRVSISYPWPNLERFTDLLMMCRMWGAPSQVSAMLVGMFVVYPFIDLYSILGLFAVGNLAHAAIGITNELGERGEDRLDGSMDHPLAKRKTNITKAAAYSMGAVLAVSTIAVSFALFQDPLATLMITLAGALGVFYNFKGKYMPVLYYLAPALGEVLVVMFGGYAVTGSISPLLVIVALGIGLMAVAGEWMGGVKDADTDRAFGVGSSSARAGYKPGESLNIERPFVLFFVLTILGVFVVFAAPIFLGMVSHWYTFVLLVFLLPTAFTIIYYYLSDPRDKTTLKTFAYRFTLFLTVIPLILLLFVTGLEPVLLLLGYVVFWFAAMRILGVKY